MKKIILFSFVFLIGITSCTNQKPLYEKTINFPDYQWNRFNILEFTPEIKKVKHTHSFSIILTYREGFPYETLPVNTVLTYPNGQKSIIRYVFLIQNEHGYMGDKIDNNRRIEAVIHSDKELADVGMYNFTIQQLTQYYDLENIVSVGCKVKTAKKVKK